MTRVTLLHCGNVFSTQPIPTLYDMRAHHDWYFVYVSGWATLRVRSKSPLMLVFQVFRIYLLCSLPRNLLYSRNYLLEPKLLLDNSLRDVHYFSLILREVDTCFLCFSQVDHVFLWIARRIPRWRCCSFSFYLRPRGATSLHRGAYFIFTLERADSLIKVLVYLWPRGS